MLELKGKYNSCKVFTDNIDSETISQLTSLLNQEFVSDSQVRIMSDCLPSYTEVLTISGFKSITELSLNDKVANYDMETGKISFSNIKTLIHRPLRSNEVVYDFKCKQSNFTISMTENHRVPLSTKVTILAKDLPECSVLHDFIYFGDGCIFNDICTKYSDLEIKLICWIVGDGNISNNGNDTYRVRFGFKKERKIKRLCKLLDEAGLTYYYSEE